MFYDLTKTFSDFLCLSLWDGWPFGMMRSSFKAVACFEIDSCSKFGTIANGACFSRVIEKYPGNYNLRKNLG